MPDPQVVYIVTAIVVLGLVAWVVVVLLRAPKLSPVVPAANSDPHDGSAAQSKPSS